MTPFDKIAAALFPARVARPAGGGEPAQVPPPATDHEKLTAGTADLWRQFAALARGTTP